MTTERSRASGRPTLEEVALRAGVGRGTVSRVVNGSVQVSPRARRVSLSVASGNHALAAALRSLEAAGLEVDDIGARQPTLDEVFLALTGLPIDDEAATAARGAAA